MFYSAGFRKGVNLLGRDLIRFRRADFYRRQPKSCALIRPGSYQVWGRPAGRLAALRITGIMSTHSVFSLYFHPEYVKSPARSARRFLCVSFVFSSKYVKIDVFRAPFSLCFLFFSSQICGPVRVMADRVARRAQE